MLNKKEIIQKTFRLDYKINEDFETLCDILERTQNDLANIAIQELLESNKEWLAQNILVDYAIDFFEKCKDVDFELENILVTIKFENDNIICKIVQKDGNEIVQTTDKVFNILDSDKEDKAYIEIKKILRYYGMLIDFESKAVKLYLESKLNYK